MDDYQRRDRTDGRDEVHVVAVCTGNICRSPMAEGILSQMPQTFPRVTASSAGTHALDGYPPSEFSVIACRERGIDISGHRAKRLEEGIVGGNDIMICMEPVHVEMVLSLDASAVGRVYNLADFSSGRLKKIADPYGGSLREYRQCFREILDCIGEFLYAKGLWSATRGGKRSPLSAL